MAIDMYLKVDGVTGESNDSNHKSWIDVLSAVNRLLSAAVAG